MNTRQAMAFIEKHGVVLQAAKGPAPSLAEEIVGAPIRGSWWAHPKGRAIFAVTTAVGESEKVLVCKLVEGKVTYVHRRLWPAFVTLAGRFRKTQLARTWNEHTPNGAHELRTIEFPKWVPDEILAKAERLSVADAERILAPWLALGLKRPR